MGLFLKGASAIISENITPHNGLVNGTECFYSSLTLQEHDQCTGPDEEDEVPDVDKIRNAKGGDVVFLSAPPVSVNVLLIEES